jgi:hypothetical protein
MGLWIVEVIADNLLPPLPHPVGLVKGAAMKRLRKWDEPKSK